MEKCVTLVFDFRSYLGLSTFFSTVVAPLLAGRGIGWSHCSAVRGDLVFQSVTKQSGPSALECFDIFFVVYPQFRLVPTGTSDRGTTFSSCCKCEKIKKVRWKFQNNFNIECNYNAGIEKLVGFASGKLTPLIIKLAGVIASVDSNSGQSRGSDGRPCTKQRTV